MPKSDPHLHDPQTLYRHWEDAQWSPFAIGLDADKEQWQGLSGDDRSLVLWALSSLMVAEERITTKFSGLVSAYGTEEEATFLATQQVDEARHMQFYARFQDEVVADPQAIAAHVARAREQLSPAFAQIFDEALVRAHERLVAEPSDAAAKVDFVTTYHMVIEGTLGLTAFNGTWFLREAVRDDPALAEGVRHTLRSLLPTVALALTPPDREGTDWDALGASSEEIRDFAVTGLSRRL